MQQIFEQYAFYSLLILPFVAFAAQQIFIKSNGILQQISNILFATLGLILSFIILLNLDNNITSNNDFKLQLTSNEQFSLFFYIDKFNVIFSALICLCWFLSSLVKNSSKDNIPLVVFLSLCLVFSNNIFSLLIFYFYLSLLSLVQLKQILENNFTKQFNIISIFYVALNLLVVIFFVNYFYYSSTNISFDQETNFFKQVSVNERNYFLIIFIAYFFINSFIALFCFIKSNFKRQNENLIIIFISALCIIKIINYIYGADYFKNLLDDNSELFIAPKLITCFLLLLTSTLACISNSKNKATTLIIANQLAYVFVIMCIFSNLNFNLAIYFFVISFFSMIGLLLFQYALTMQKGLIRNISLSLSVVNIFNVLGLPFTVGFIVKKNIFTQLLDSEFYYILAVLILNNLLMIAVFIKLFTSKEILKTEEITLSNKISLLFSTLLVSSILLLLFFIPIKFLEF